MVSYQVCMNGKPTNIFTNLKEAKEYIEKHMMYARLYSNWGDAITCIPKDGVMTYWDGIITLDELPLDT